MVLYGVSIRISWPKIRLKLKTKQKLNVRIVLGLSNVFISITFQNSFWWAHPNFVTKLRLMGMERCIRYKNIFSTCLQSQLNCLILCSPWGCLYHKLSPLPPAGGLVGPTFSCIIGGQVFTEYHIPENQTHNLYWLPNSCTALHCTALHFTSLHCTTLH